MVHLPIPMKKALTIPDAKSAVDKEWKAPGDLPAWDLLRVRPKAEVIAEAKQKKLSAVEELLSESVQAETWISLPRERCPEH